MKKELKKLLSLFITMTIIYSIALSAYCENYFDNLPDISNINMDNIVGDIQNSGSRQYVFGDNGINAVNYIPGGTYYNEGSITGDIENSIQSYFINNGNIEGTINNGASASEWENGEILWWSGYGFTDLESTLTDSGFQNNEKINGDILNNFKSIFENNGEIEGNILNFGNYISNEGSTTEGKIKNETGIYNNNGEITGEIENKPGYFENNGVINGEIKNGNDDLIYCYSDDPTGEKNKNASEFVRE